MDDYRSGEYAEELFPSFLREDDFLKPEGFVSVEKKRPASLALISPKSASHSSARRKFSRLRDTWLQNVMFLSNTEKIYFDPAYQMIIGMGPQALPWIIEELTSDSGDWFWALECISGVNAARRAEPGDYAAAKKAWLNWAKTKKLL